MRSRRQPNLLKTGSQPGFCTGNLATMTQTYPPRLSTDDWQKVSSMSSVAQHLHRLGRVGLPKMTGRGLAVAGLVAAEVVPVLVLGPVAGVLIDRFSRKAILIGADLVRAALVPTAALAAGCGSVARLSRCCWPGCRPAGPDFGVSGGGWTHCPDRRRSAFPTNAASFVGSPLLISTLRIPAHAG